MCTMACQHIDLLLRREIVCTQECSRASIELFRLTRARSKPQHTDKMAEFRHICPTYPETSPKDTMQQTRCFVQTKPLMLPQKMFTHDIGVAGKQTDTAHRSCKMQQHMHTASLWCYATYCTFLTDAAVICCYAIVHMGLKPTIGPCLMIHLWVHSLSLTPALVKTLGFTMSAYLVIPLAITSQSEGIFGYKL